MGVMARLRMIQRAAESCTSIEYRRREIFWQLKLKESGACKRREAWLGSLESDLLHLHVETSS